MNSYPKMYRFQVPGKAYFVLLTSGNRDNPAIVHRIGRDLAADDADADSRRTADMADAAVISVP
ncbi:MAG: hypothetical protein IPM37_22870 [Hahellaceae bacterium]|nr:hypothetical protein [Hahellaceae bacterium]